MEFCPGRAKTVVAGGVFPVNRGEKGDAGELGTAAAAARRPGAGAAGADRQGTGDCAAGVGVRVSTTFINSIAKDCCFAKVKMGRY